MEMTSKSKRQSDGQQIHKKHVETVEVGRERTEKYTFLVVETYFGKKVTSNLRRPVHANLG